MNLKRVDSTEPGLHHTSQLKWGQSHVMPPFPEWRDAVLRIEPQPDAPTYGAAPFHSLASEANRRRTFPSP